MKKVLLLGVVCFVCSVCPVFANWAFGIGLGFPKYDFEANEKSIDMNVVDLDMTLLRINDVGFTLKFGLDMGVAWSSDVEEDGTSVGFDFRGDFGLGFTPIRTDHFMLTALGVVGFGLDLFSTSGSWTDSSQQGTYKVRECEYENQWNYVHCHIGAEATAHFKCNEAFGFYATLGVQKLFAGRATWRVDETRYSGYYYAAYKSTYSDHDGNSMSGTILPVFAVGIMMYM